MRTSCFVVALSLLGLGAAEAQIEEIQIEEESVQALQQEPKEPEVRALGAEQASTMIGMEAYREVLESGRYRVGPGDGFTFMIGTEGPFFSEVLAEGGLFVPQIGLVKVGGKNLGESRQAIEEAFHRTFREEGEITIELSQLRQFPVPVAGVVGQPGLYVASGVVRISELLRQAEIGGASRRNVRIIKTDVLGPEVWKKQIEELARAGDIRGVEALSERVDLDLYAVTGNSRYNPFVEDGDLIYVPRREGSIVVNGAVQRSATFEFVEGDRISDMLILALGPTPDCDQNKVALFRYSQDMSIMYTSPVDIKAVLQGDPQADLAMQAGDWLVFRPLKDYQELSTVVIAGEVVFPGPYVIEKDKTTLREIIEKAGGFTGDASLHESRVVRLPSETGVVDPELERISEIPVSARDEEENQYFIMKSREIAGQMVVDFVALFEEGDESQNIRLIPGDVVNVASQQFMVKVSGQASFPGAVVYNRDYGVWEYIERAGGFGWRASKDVRIIKAKTGELKRAEDVEQLEPGDRIWIKEEPKRDYWEIFTQAMAVVGNVSTVVLIFVSLTR